MHRLKGCILFYRNKNMEKYYQGNNVRLISISLYSVNTPGEWTPKCKSINRKSEFFH